MTLTMLLLMLMKRMVTRLQVITIDSRLRRRDDRDDVDDGGDNDDDETGDDVDDNDEAVGDNDRWRIASERNFDLLLLHLRHTLLLNMIVIMVIIMIISS